MHRFTMFPGPKGAFKGDNLCDQIRRKLRIYSHLLKKSLNENFVFCGVTASNHGTIIRTGITYLRKSLCICATDLAGGVVLKMKIYVEDMLNIFKISRG